MGRIKYEDPIKSVHGRLGQVSNGRVDVHRQKTFGIDADGKPILGPQEVYFYHLHEGKWSEGATRNRDFLKEVNIVAKQELADSQLAQQWKEAFQTQLKHPVEGQKRYVKFYQFVIAQIHARLKTNSTPNNQ